MNENLEAGSMLPYIVKAHEVWFSGSNNDIDNKLSFNRFGII